MVSRLAYIALWNHADDYGVIRACPTYLHSKCFPYDPTVDMRTVLRPVVDSGRLVLFESNNETYGNITNFLKHQRVNRPNTKNRNPKLTDGSLSDHGVLSEDRLFLGDPSSLTLQVGVVSNLTQTNNPEEVKPTSGSGFTEHSMIAHEPIRAEVKLNKTKSCKQLPTVAEASALAREGSSSSGEPLVFQCMFTGNAYVQSQCDEGMGWWKYYNHLGKKTTRGWHEQKWVNVRSQVLQCVGQISDGDMRIALRYAAMNTDCRFMDKKDLFVSPALIFGRPGEDVGSRLDRLLARAKAWDAKFQPKSVAPAPTPQDEERNKELARKRLEQLERAPDAAMAAFAGSEAHKAGCMRRWKEELEGASKSGKPFFDYLEQEHA
tara:strand:+ start:3396 stop:4526 length:1131 start_codon:yes stop_codon:yes gene_type:complete